MAEFEETRSSLYPLSFFSYNRNGISSSIEIENIDPIIVKISDFVARCNNMEFHSTFSFLFFSFFFQYIISLLKLY
jgi:hypothetical protein